MANLDLKVIFDDSEIDKSIDQLTKKINNIPKISPLPKSNPTTSKPFVDEKANKTIQESINALSLLDARAAEVAKQIANLRTQSGDLASAKKELSRQFYAGEISASQYNTALSGVEIEQRRVALGLQDLNRAVKHNIQLEGAAVGSLEEARIKYNQLTQAITKAGGAMDGSNPAVTKMIEEHKKLRAEIDTMEQKMGQYQRNVGNYASGWNGMQNSINQLTRELPAFTFSAQTGFMAISNNLPIMVDELKKAADANKALSAEGKKGVPVWKQLTGALFGWQTAMMLGITLMTVYGKEIGEWVKSLFKGKDALEQLKKEKKEFAEVTQKGTQDAQGEITSLQSLYRATQNASLSYAERIKAIKQIQSQYPSYFKNLSNEAILAGNAKGAYEALTNSILAAAKARAYESKIAEITSKQIENTDKILEKANSISPGDRRAMRMDSQTIASGGMMMFTTASKDAYEAIDAIKELNKENAELTKSAERYQKAVDDLVKSNGVSVLTGDFNVGKVNKISNKELNEYKSLIEKVGDIDREYARLELSEDDSAIAAIKDKFADITKEIEEYNKKKPKIEIDVEKVNSIRDKAIENLKFEQGTTQLAKDIDEQKELIQQYENYRTRFGAEKANERYKNELELIKSYRSRLEQEYFSLIGSDPTASLGSAPAKKLTQAEQKRAELLEKEIKASKDAEVEKQEALLATLISYESQRKRLIEDYNLQRKELIEQGKDEEAAVLDAKHNEELNSLDDTNIKKLAAYKDLFDGIEKLTDAGARRVIAAGKDMLASMPNLSPELRKQIEEQIKQAEISLDDRLPKRTLEVANGFQEIASNLKDVNEELSNMLGGLANILRATVQVSDGITSLKNGLANYKENKASGGGGILGTISAVAGVAGPVGQIVSAVSTVASGVIKFFKASKESARQAAEQMKQYQQSILQGELEYNKLLRERVRSHKDINDLTNLEIRAQQELLRTQGGSVQNDFNKQLKALQQGGQQITGQKTEKYGGFLGIGKKTRVVDITAGLAGKTYEEIEKLYTSNKLTEATKKQFEALRDLKGEVDDIAKLWDDAQQVFADRMSGGATADSITKSIIDGIKGGKRAFQDFGDDIESIIQDALLSGLAYQYLDEPVRALVDQFRKDALDGLDTNEIEAFRSGYEAILQTAGKLTEEAEKALGKSIGGDSSSGTIKGQGIESMTEKSSQEFKANFRSIN